MTQRQLQRRVGCRKLDGMWVALLVGAAIFLFAGRAMAAEVRGGDDADRFHLPAGEVINDDLYVGAGEILIDGIVEGDLVAAGGYIEVNGEVTGDVILAGGGVVINGSVGDDARIAAGGVTITGSIGDDLFVAGGGPFWPGGPVVPIRIGARTIAPGVQLATSATVGGDAYLVGGRGVLNGAVSGDLFGGMGSLAFGGNVRGDARLYAERVTVGDSARVAGELRYGSGQPLAVPAGVAATVEQDDAMRTTVATPTVSPFARVWGWLWRTVLMLIGFALLTWVVWQLAPETVRGASNAIAARPVEAGLYGVVAAALTLPVVAALVLIGTIFWGLVGSLASSSFLMGLVGLLWILSPLVTGHWVGRQLGERGYIAGELSAFLAGVLAIVVAARLLSVIPCVGVLAAGLIYLVSFALTLGGIILARRGSRTATPPLLAPETGG
ncbi:MAG: hypothetical protein KJZ93_05390 [Caldilineaceae bacterium]|nr:hypothetical protein [Caldilineaceae bacterium]